MGQRLIGVFQLFVKIVDFLLQSHELMSGVLVFAERGDRLGDFFRIHLSGQVHFDDDAVAVEREVGLLIEHQHESGRIGPDFISRDARSLDDCHAFQIGRDLLQRVAFRRFGRQANRVFSRIAVTHPVFAL